MKINNNLSTILRKEMEEKWVALSQDQKEVVDSSRDLVELRTRLGEKRNDYTYMKVLRSDMEFAFANTHD